MIGVFLLVLLFLCIAMRTSRDSSPFELSRAGITALLTPMLPLVILATAGIRIPLRATQGVLLLSLVAWFPWRGGRSFEREEWGTLTLAALTGLTGAAGLALSPIMHDLYAHLAWSKDLVAAREFYPLGFPALLRLYGSDLWPQVATLRALPAVLGMIFALQCIEVGQYFHSRSAGALAALAYLLKSSKVDPALPEFLAVIMIVATWREVLTLRGRTSFVWLGVLSLSLVLVHVSTLELVHFVVLTLVIVGVGTQPAFERLRALGAVALGATVGALSSPMIRNMAYGKGILLSSQQPSRVNAFHLKSLAWNWGYGFDLALLISVLFLLRGCTRDGRWRWVAIFSLGGALLVAPMLLSGLGITIPLEMFDYRQYLSALLFACLAWLVIIARAPLSLKTVFAILLTGQVAYASKIDPWRILIAASGLSLVLFGLHRSVIGRSARAFASLIAIAIIARILLWAPETPPWVRWFQKNASSESVVMANWPAINLLDALTEVRARDGLAGPDANLALHRLKRLPEYRNRLDSCDPGGAFSDSLAVLLEGMPGKTSYVVIHDEYKSAWSQYAQDYARIHGERGPGRFSMYETAPCSTSGSARLTLMNAELRKDIRFYQVYDDQSCQVYRFAP